MKNLCRVLLFAALVLFTSSVWAATDGSITGTVHDGDGVAVSQIPVQLLSPDGHVLNQTTTSLTGEYQFFPVIFGDYQIAVNVSGFAPYVSQVHVASGTTTQVDVALSKEAKEMVLNVAAKKHVIQSSASTSSKAVTKEQIAEMPQGETIQLPKLLADTTPGVVSGPFGQSFIRGNHANIQYQIDGVQLPDSPSNTFGEAFTPRNIDHMEVITGGVPAEYGERLAAVVNIVTKSGTETPNGEVELDYGSYNTSSPYLLYSGSNAAGDLHYFFSAGFTRTDRGLDTPQPQDENTVTQGGTDAIHDVAWGDNQFAKIDWLPDNTNKYSFIAFNSYDYYQIPNFPGTFNSQDFYFSNGYTDQFGNGPNTSGNPATPWINWVPSTTDDDQQEMNSYIEAVWKHTLSEHSYFQLAPYYKYSYVGVKNDPANDLASANVGANQISGAQPSSFTESRPVSNYGLKGDYTQRFGSQHLFKTGFQLQGSQSTGGISVITTSGPVVVGSPSTFVSSSDNSVDSGYFESFYAQDDYSITKDLIVNVGFRVDGTQFTFGSGVNSNDGLLQPRVGVNYMLTDTTKIHVFYGKLFQPAPVENLRDTFVNLGQGPQFSTYDIKAEKDDYYELGIAQQWGEYVFEVNEYFKNAVNMLDDTQLLNTSIAQPYNFSQGFAYGTEFSVKGSIASRWTDYLNYAYEIAMGNGVSGGLFVSSLVGSAGNWQYLDHVQISTGNAGVTYHTDNLWWTTQALFGSGLRTGANNGNNLPAHLTFDTSLGYEFRGESWWEKFKLSVDLLNIANDVYPITVANGFNGNHYAAGREFFVHLIKEL